MFSHEENLYELYSITIVTADAECDSAECSWVSREELGCMAPLQLWAQCNGDCKANVSRKLKSRYGARNRFQEPSLELSSQAT